MSKLNVKEIQDLSNEGKSVEAIRGFILFTYGIKGKEVTALLEKAGISSKRSGGVTGEFYDLLKDKEMNEEVFKVWIESKSTNVQNHLKHYDGIRVLANSIRSSK